MHIHRIEKNLRWSNSRPPQLKFSFQNAVPQVSKLSTNQNKYVHNSFCSQPIQKENSALINGNCFYANVNALAVNVRSMCGGAVERAFTTPSVNGPSDSGREPKFQNS